MESLKSKPPLRCPHCTNEDKSLIDIHKVIKNYINGSDKIIYHCEVCGKEFQ